jgi:hypothetical protein
MNPVCSGLRGVQNTSSSKPSTSRICAHTALVLPCTANAGTAGPASVGAETTSASDIKLFDLTGIPAIL